MPTPDRRPGPEIVEKLVFEDEEQSLDGPGQLFYDFQIGAFKMRDSVGEYDPRAGGGISEAQHRALRQLIHFIDDGPAEGFASGAYKEVIGGIFPTSIIWYESSSKLKKIVAKTITRSGGGATKTKPTPIAWVVYDTDGVTPLGTVSDAITYSGVREVSRTRTITV